MSDILDKLSENPDEKDAERGALCMVVLPRARDTSHHAELEKIYLNSGLGDGPNWVTPFFEAADNSGYPAKLNSHEILQLGKLGISEEEWRELVWRKPQ